ncbi:hypothetical protein EIP86_002997 [Pleurotus ostreatoroseus]|nr:hypothetical protein EIP86_002997 [Pleurotus ostreatoroseus]
MQEGWQSLDRFLYDLAREAKDVRVSFNTIMTTVGGRLSHDPEKFRANNPFVEVAGHAQQISAREARASRSSPRLSAHSGTPSSRSGVPQQYLQDQAPHQNSRVRPRAGSMDGSYSQFTGPGGPPPSKRQRGGDYERDLQVPPGRPYSQSPGNSPRMVYQNGQVEHSPGLVAAQPVQYTSQRHRPRIDRDDGVQGRHRPEHPSLDAPQSSPAPIYLAFEVSVT